MKKFYYIASEDVTNLDFKFQIVKRCDSYEDAVSYLKGKAEEWANKGLNARLLDVDGIIYGADAMDSEFAVKHMYKIFGSPCFMAGGSIGL